MTNDEINDRLELALSIGDIGRADILRELQTTRAALEQSEQKAAQYANDWYAAKAEFGETTVQLRAEAVRWKNAAMGENVKHALASDELRELRAALGALQGAVEKVRNVYPHDPNCSGYAGVGACDCWQAMLEEAMK